jgi:hypothetical protein
MSSHGYGPTHSQWRGPHQPRPTSNAQGSRDMGRPISFPDLQSNYTEGNGFGPHSIEPNVAQSPRIKYNQQTGRTPSRSIGASSNPYPLNSATNAPNAKPSSKTSTINSALEAGGEIAANALIDSVFDKYASPSHGQAFNSTLKYALINGLKPFLRFDTKSASNSGSNRTTDNSK